MSILATPVFFVCLLYITDFKPPDHILVLWWWGSPFSFGGMICSLIQARLLAGRIVPIYLCTAWISSFAAGVVSGAFVLSSLVSNDGVRLLGTYWDIGFFSAILSAVFIYGLATSMVLVIFRSVDKSAYHAPY